ncbi:hypothetical protein ACFX4N_24450 [Priestia sp. YIM B13551]|uniref:hypothetical protein n=1 Tax=Priestia sp. YIM B13551 TaxID=3366306 RepID=UPI00366CD8FB
MNKLEAVEIIKHAFIHLMYEENVKVGSTNILLYFPTIGIALVEPKRDREDLQNDNVEDLDELYIKKELKARQIVVDFEDKDFSVGYIINDILLEARFVPGERSKEDKIF